MAENKIDVVFGAQIAGLISGVAEAREAIEGLRAPFNQFDADLRGIAEAIGITFAVEKIKEFATGMAELGEKTLNTAYMLGMSVKEYGQLTGALSLVGVNAEEAQRTLERLAVNVQKVAEGNKKAAAEFHNMGITTQEVIAHGNSLTEMLTLMIERFQKLDPAFRNVALLHSEMGRGVERLAGAFRAGDEGWKEALHAAAAYADALAKVAPAMADTEEKINALALDVKTLKLDAFDALKPAIDTVIAAFDDLVKAADNALKPLGDNTREMTGLEVAIRVVIKTIADVIEIVHILAKAFDLLQVSARELTEELLVIFTGLKNEIVALFTGGSIQAAYDRMMGQLEAITLSRGNRLVADWQDIVNRVKSIMSPDVVLPDVAVTAPAARGGRRAGTESGAGGKGGANKEYEDFAAGERLKIAEAQNDWAKISQIYEEWAARAKQQFGETSKEYRTVLLEMTHAHQQHIRQLFSQEEQGYSEMRTIDSAYLKTFENNMSEMAKKHEISKQQEFGFDIEYASKLHDLQRKTLEDMMQNDEFTVEQKKKLYLQLLQLDAEYEAKASGLREKAMGDTAKTADEMAKGISHGISGAAVGLITGKQTVGQTAAGLGENVLQKIMDSVADKLITNALSNLLQQLASDAANTGILAFLLTALNIKPSFLGTTYQYGGIVPSAAGGWVVPRFQGGGMPSILHANEMVLPSHISEGLQQMIANGGAGDTHMHLHGPVDLGWFKDQMVKNAPAIQQMFRQGALTPRNLSRSF